MSRVKIVVDGWKCERCSHQWIPVRKGEEPAACPKCHSPHWNKVKR